MLLGNYYYFGMKVLGIFSILGTVVVLTGAGSTTKPTPPHLNLGSPSGAWHACVTSVLGCVLRMYGG
jgi:hypothetical protein